MNKCVKQLFLVLSLSFVVIFAALALLTLPVRAADQCVAPGGAGGCHASIQAAIDTANSGDIVRVVAGTYIENVVISKNVTLLGGFNDTSLASRTPRSSIINGGGSDSVIKISNSAAVTIDGFTITGGNATANGGEGGGISIREATANILDNLIEGNVGSSDPAVRGRGGGIDVISSTSPVLVGDNTIRANLAYSVALTSPTVALFGIGGGIWLDAASSALITGNQVLSNVAARTDVPGVAFGGGGGVGGGGDETNMTIEGNTIQGNIGNEVGGDGVGGGIALFSIGVTTITNNSVVQNTAAVSGTFVTGGGIRATVVQTLTLADNWVAQNIAAIRAPDAQGGGIYLSASSGSGQYLTLTGNWVMSNTAGVTVTGSTSFGGPFASGGGVRIWGGDADNDTLTMQDNHLIGNVAAWTMATSASSGAGHAQGGGLTVERISTTLIISNEVRGNMAVEDMSLSGSGDWGGGSSGGGMHLRDNDAVTLRENEVRDNITAKTQTVSGVSSGNDSGGIALINVDQATVTNNLVSGNTAVVSGSLTSATGENYGGGGGGITVGCWDRLGCSLSLENNQVINNVGAKIVTTSGTGSTSHIDGGGMNISSISTTLIISNEVRANTSVENLFLSGSGGWGGRPSGGGMSLFNNDALTLEDNEIRDNITVKQQTLDEVSSNSEGGGIAIGGVQSTTITNNTISGNIAVMTGSISSNMGEGYFPNGGGVMAACWDRPDCSLTFTDNDISNNTLANIISISGSDADSGAEGGGIHNRDATLNISNTVVLTNTATDGGGGIYNDGGTLNIANSTFSGNSGGENGGGIQNTNGGIVNISDSTLNDNAVTISFAEGGAIKNRGGSTLNVTNSTISGNSANNGGGIFNDVDSTVTITNSTLYGNSVSGGGSEIFDDGGLVTVTNSIVANNNPSNVCVVFGMLTSGGHNLDSGDSCGLTATGDITNTDPLLGPLQDNGGDTETHALLAGSPAIDAGDNAACPATDQRGVARPQGATCDIGAYEAQILIYLPVVLKN